jgi:hypothetical protein
MGLRLKRIETRRAFVRAPGHPALEGLADPDFSFLRGDSDLIEPYPDPGPMPQEYPTHFWHWGNDNIVATYALEKPQVGAARALLDCGFDLAEAALLEAARGEGLLLFCQVDVTHRVGDDPVCTRLVQNLLRCLSLPADRPAGAVSLAELARRNPPAATVEGYRFPAPALPGIHDGDLFFRERLRLPAFDPRSRSPLFTEVESAGQRCWITSLSAAELRSDWQRARRARVESALRLFNGERTVAGPSLQAFDDRNRLYPYNWAHLPLMGCDFDPYVYWRW